MGQIFKQALHQRRYMNAKQAQKMIPNISHQGNQLKAIIRYNTSTRMATVSKQNKIKTKCGQGRETRNFFVCCLQEYKMYSTLENNLAHLKKLNIYLLYNSLLYPAICPGEMKMYVHKKTCMQMFTAASFILVKTQTQ